MALRSYDPDSADARSLQPNRRSPLLTRLFHIVFGADTPAGRAFDVALMFAIVASVVVVMLESVAAVRTQYAEALRIAEWFFTILFTVEYLLRLAIVARPLRYARSFFGIVDLLAVIPTYLSALVPGAQYLLVVRLLRILRAFRVLKLAQYLEEADLLVTSLRHSRRKIMIFLFAVLTMTIILGSMMYLIEGAEHGFTSIPRSVYWAIVTLTTVGYGDISPQTDAGQALAALVMIMGYGIIAVPTGIVTAEITAEQGRRDAAARETMPGPVCGRCGLDHHVPDARFCRRCGNGLPVFHPAPPPVEPAPPPES